MLNRGKSEKWEENFFLISALGWCSRLAYFTLMCLSTFLLFPFFLLLSTYHRLLACKNNGKWERFLKTFKFLGAHHSHENEWLRFVLFFYGDFSVPRAACGRLWTTLDIFIRLLSGRIFSHFITKMMMFRFFQYPRLLYNKFFGSLNLCALFA